MPSKRTNDSVERILQELNQQQEAKGIRDGVTERNVDEILRSIPRSGAHPDDATVQLGPIPQSEMPKVEVSADVADPESRFSTQAIDALLADLPIFRSEEVVRHPASAVTAKPAPARRTAPAAPAAQPKSSARPAQQPAYREETPVQRTEPEPRTEQTVRAPEPEPRQDVGQDREQPENTLGDTTRTGIIKNFLRQMSGEDTEDLSQRKNQFQRFFEESVAVVPDDKGKLPSEKKRGKKRGLFGRGDDTGEITDEFVPINVSIMGRNNTQDQPEEQPEEDSASHREAPRKKRGLFGLFGGRDESEEMEPESDLTAYPEEEPALRQEPEEPAPMPEPETDIPAAEPEYQPQPQPEPEPETQKYVYRSKYAGTRRVHGSLTDTLSSLGLYHTDAFRIRAQADAKRAAAALKQPQPSTQEEVVPQEKPAVGAALPEEAAPRKKRDTLEFTPGQKAHTMPEQEGRTQTFHASEPVGEPVMTGSDTLTSGFGTNLNDDDRGQDTRDFLKALQPDLPQQNARRAGGTAGASRQKRRDSLPNTEVPAEPAAQTVRPARTEPADAPVQAEAKARTAQMDRTAPMEEPAEERTMTGQVKLDLSAGAESDDVDRTMTGQVRLDAPDQPSDTRDFDLDILGPQIEEKPNTEQFVRGIAQTLNAGLDAAQEETTSDRYAEAAARLTAQEPDDEAEQPRKKRGRMRFAGNADDEHEGGESGGPFAAAEHRHKLDYETTEDAPKVRQELDKQNLLATVVAIVSGAAALVMLYLGTAVVGSLPMPAPLNPDVSAAPLLVVMLVLLLVTCALNWKTLLDGCIGLVRSPTPDTMPSLAALGALIQLLVFLIQPEWYDPAKFCLMSGPAALLLCFNAVGKMLDARTVRANFDLVSAGVDHAVAYRLRDAAVLRTVTRGLGETKPCLLVSRPTVLLKNFLAGSGAHRTSDKSQQQFSWALGVCGLLSLVFTLLYRGDPGMAFSAMAAVFCLGTPLSGTLISALPAQLMQRSAARVGAVIPGWKDIRQLGRTNIIQITARDLFPSGCVTLTGIRPIGKERIDLAIPIAASVLAEGSTTLRDVFLGMIGNDRKLLLKVDDLKTVYGKGYVAWVNGSRVLVGNRALMEEYEIHVPSMDFERRHSVNQRRVIYLAVSGNLTAMFQVSYQRDPDTAAVLESLRRAGMSIIVDCDDFNCDVNLVETVYGLPGDSVKVLNAEEREALAPATAWLPESEGNMLHLGSFASFVGGLEAAAGAAEGEHRASIVLAASVLISCVLAVIMSLAGGIVSLPLPAMVLYQAGWAVLALVFPMTQRY